MAIGPIGNVIYVNQQTSSITPLQGNQNTRFDLQNVAAQAIVNEKQKEIEDVRPTEENHEVDPDREHTKQELDEELSDEGKRKKKKESKEDDEESQGVIEPPHIDIKV